MTESSTANRRVRAGGDRTSGAQVVPSTGGEASASRLATRRIIAWCVDWLVISLYATALIPLGLLVIEHSGRMSPVAGNVAAFALLVMPATIWMAAWERGSSAAPPGKRLLSLRVDPDGQPSSGWRRALTRNGIKIALPWELGHTAAFELANPHASTPAVAVGLACGITACLIVSAYLVMLFTGTGRTPYDRISNSRVRSAR